jgi:hypothetical protein
VGKGDRGSRGGDHVSAELCAAIKMIVFGGGEGPRFVGGGRGCLIMLLVSVVLSLVLTVIANLVLRLL